MYDGYVVHMSKISDSEPSSYEEATKKQLRKDAIPEEYKSILNNNVGEVVPKPEGNSIVTSIWIYKIKHVAYGSVEKYKAKFLA